jgi:hypothetical protein
MALRIFIGYGYNERDRWIEEEIFSILRSLNLEILHGKDLYNEESLQVGVKDRILQSNGIIGFCTLRAGQEQAAYNSHPWVRDELLFAMGAGKPIVHVREDGVQIPPGMLGERQFIRLDQSNRLACAVELVRVISSWNIRRLQIVPRNDQLARDIHRNRKSPNFVLRYRTRIGGIDSEYREARVDAVDAGFYLDAIGVPSRCLIEIEGALNGALLFTSSWDDADVVKVTVE